MAKYRPHIVFTLLMIAYLITRYLRSFSANISDFVRYYLTDLIFIPAMATFALIFVRILKRDSKLLLSLPLILMQTTFISLFFEWYLPRYGMNDNQYTSDPIDVLMYFLGAILFWVLQMTILKTRPHTTNPSR